MRFKHVRDPTIRLYLVTEEVESFAYKIFTVVLMKKLHFRNRISHVDFTRRKNIIKHCSTELNNERPSWSVLTISKYEI